MSVIFRNWFFWELKQAAKALWQQKSNLILAMVFGFAAATFVLFLGVLVRHNLSVPAGVPIEGNYATLTRTLYGGFDVRWPRRVIEQLDQTDLKGRYGLFAQLKLPVRQGEADEREMRVGLISPQLFSLFDLPMRSGRALGESGSREAVISERLLKQTGQLPKKLRIDDKTFVVVGVLAEAFCGFAAECADFWVADGNASLANTEGDREMDQRSKLSSSGIELVAGARKEMFHVLAKLPDGAVLQHYQQPMEQLDWSPLFRDLVFPYTKPDGSPSQVTALINRSTKDAVASLHKGLFVDRIEAASKATAVSVLLVVSSLLLMLAVLSLWAGRAAQTLAQMKNLSIRERLGANARSWWYRAIAETGLPLMPAALGGLLFYELLRRYLGGLPGIGIALAQRMEPLSLALAGQMLLLMLVAVAAVTLACLLPLLIGFRRNSTAASNHRRQGWTQAALLGLASAVLSLAAPGVVWLLEQQAEWENPAQVGRVEGLTVIKTPRLKSISMNGAGPITILPTARELQPMLASLPIPAVQMMRAPLQPLRMPESLRLREQAKGVLSFPMHVGPGFFQMFGLRLLAGRLPLEEQVEEVVLSETLLSTLGISPEQAIGRELVAETSYDKTPLLVVGVVSDLRYESPRGQAEPVLYRPMRRNNSGMTVAVQSTDPAMVEEVVEKIRAQTNQPRSEFSVYTQQSRLDELNQPFRALARLALAVAAVAMLLLVFFIASTVGISLRTHMRNLAILATLGAGSLAQIRMMARLILLPVFLGCGLGFLAWLSAGGEITDQGLALTALLLLGCLAAVILPAVYRLRRLDLASALRL